jgi:hypothetical protein
LTFEILVPRELRHKIRTQEQRNATQRIIGAVVAAVQVAFPWAYEIRARHEFMYAWDDRT